MRYIISTIQTLTMTSLGKRSYHHNSWTLQPRQLVEHIINNCYDTFRFSSTKVSR